MLYGDFMIRETYVTSEGNSVDYKKVYIKRYSLVLILIILVIITSFIYITFKNKNQRDFCTNMVENIKKASLKYAEEREILPNVAGDYVEFTLEDLIKEKYIQKSDITVKEKVATSDIVITRYKKDLIVTVDLDNAEYCSTKNKNWSKETEKYDKNREVVSVVAYYNYRNQETNVTNWSKEVNEEDLNKEEDKKYHIHLPKDERVLPTIPNDATLQDIEVNKKVYYQYQDKRWKFYDIQGNYTNYFSSEKPDGYANYDANTMKMTDWTEYSQSYPEEKEYRRIETKNGYKWYYMDGKKKVYYNNGMYAVEAPDEYDQKEKDTIKMYRYQDRVYRWYNGQRRRYSSYTSTIPKGYTYKDDELMSLTSWSSIYESSSINNSNRDYRIERIINRYQFRKKYVIYSFDLLDKDVKKEEFLEKINSTLEEIMNDKKYDVKITYKFQYK